MTVNVSNVSSVSEPSDTVTNISSLFTRGVPSPGQVATSAADGVRLLNARGVNFSPVAPGGYASVGGATGAQIIARALLSALGNGTATLSPLDRASPITRAIAQPFSQQVKSQRAVR